MAKTERIKAYKKGHSVERLAAMYLRLRGYSILKIRYKTPVGEIDIIARRKNVLAFVEVKGRGNLEKALRSVTIRNQFRVAKAARYFLMTYPQFSAMDLRFDIVVFAPPLHFRHLDNAWRERT